MSAAPTQPTPSPLPVRPKEDADRNPTSRPHTKPNFPTPKLRLATLELDHLGSNVFFRNTNPSTALSEAVDAVLSTLYQPTKTNDHIRACRSVTLFLHAMDGVAYTIGSALDDDHKEIHFSLDYINKIPSARQQEEIQGVLVHEMVHCWQWNAKGTAPGGLIEGIADFVRLKAGFSPPHWKKEPGGQWDAGYQHTGYFLEWIEKTCGEGSVRRINLALKDTTYHEDEFWERLFDKNVDLLWQEYEDTLHETWDTPEKANISVRSNAKGLQEYMNDDAEVNAEDKTVIHSKEEGLVGNEKSNDIWA